MFRTKYFLFSPTFESDPNRGVCQLSVSRRRGVSTFLNFGIISSPFPSTPVPVPGTTATTLLPVQVGRHQLVKTVFVWREAALMGS